MTAQDTSLSPQQLNRPTRYGYRRTPVSNWCELIPGDIVLLTGPKPEDRYLGLVDAVQEDGSMVWLVLENAGGRRLFLNGDGHQILVNPNPQGPI